MMTEKNHDLNSEGDQSETPSERLRRLLAASNKEQKVQPISSSGEAGSFSARKELADTQPIKVSRSEHERNNEEQTENQGSSKESSLADELGNLGREIREMLADLRQVVKKAFDDWRNKAKTQKKDKIKPVSTAKGESFFSRLRKNPGGCLLYGFLGSAFIVIVIGFLSLSFLIFQYFRIASDLPSVDDLRQYASQFETTRIYDRNGNLIYEILDPNAGRRTYITLDNVSPYVIASTIAVEDKDFYTNPGFDPWGIMRALWQNYTSGEVVSGASTITQQLARTLLLSPEERSQVTTRRKAREIVLAAEITRKYSKDEILELYLNEIYYGNLAYGIEAAAETYFNTSADQLNMAQATFLAGLPQSPAVYDIFSNREATLRRHQDVLNLTYQLSKERACIDINQSSVPICVTLNEAVAAAQEMENFTFIQRPVNMPFPHWVNFIRAQLEAQFDPQTIYRSGFKVYTTLDPELQTYAHPWRHWLPSNLPPVKSWRWSARLTFSTKPSAGK